MDSVNIYIAANIKSPRKQDGAYLYLLELETAKGPATLSKMEHVEQVTENQVQLLALTAAVKRLTKVCDLHIFTDSHYLAAGFTEWLEKWKANGWKNSKGKPVAYREEWLEAAEILCRNTFLFNIGNNHPYRSWMEMELQKEK